jgi:acetyltransferase-like isoleucine patch superfamily enzyme
MDTNSNFLQTLRQFRRSVKYTYLVSIGYIKLHACTKVGKGTWVEGRVQINNSGKILLGNDIRIVGNQIPVELLSYPTGTLSIGNGTFINSGVSICATSSVTIGCNCLIGQNTMIMDTDLHDVTDIHKSPEPSPVVIEDNVWLAARVIVLKGVRIGKGAVVAAGAVVTKNVAAYTLVAGVPAKVIRNINSYQVISDTSENIASDLSYSP